MDYQGNAKKDKIEGTKPEKKIERVITTEVIVQKKSLGRKIKDVFIEADFKTVAKYVISDVLLPAIRNTIVDASTKGIERMMYGESAMRRRTYGGYGYGAGPRITYQSPVRRGYQDPISRSAPPVPQEARSRLERQNFILSSREEAALVLERMKDIIDVYDRVSVADLNDLIGFPTTYVDNKWGWNYLGDVQIRQVRDGYLIDLPLAEIIEP